MNGSIEDDGLEGDSDAESDSDDDGDAASVSGWMICLILFLAFEPGCRNDSSLVCF